MTTDLATRRSEPDPPSPTAPGPGRHGSRRPGAQRVGDPLPELFRVMAARHGVIDTRTARGLGLTRRTERTLIVRGVLVSPAVGVLVASAAPATWEQRALIAVLSPGSAVLSHGAAARLHELDGFERYEPIDVLCAKGSWPRPPAGAVTHHTRGLTASDVVEVRSIPTLTVAATLTLLAPTAGLRATERALDSALRSGASIEELTGVAVRWRRRGRPGPAQLLRLLDDRDRRTRRLEPVGGDRSA